MLADLGFGILLVTFLVSLYSIAIAFYGERKKSNEMVESARRAMLITFPLLTVASLILIYLLINNRFDVEYVYSVTSRSMPMYLKVTALWGGQAGSLLFWAWLLTLFTSAVTLRKWDRDREFLPWVIIVSMVSVAFFLSLNIFFENPFARLWRTLDGNILPFSFQPAGATPFFPQDGQGLNPLLRHPGMIIHPPTLYLGFVGYVIPFAFAIAALITGRTDDRWIRITRRWSLWAWLFLSIGIILGGRWAYDVLGWGGYWAWDPVEVASLLPWLTGTAFLHSVMIQEKRGLFKHWNMILIIMTYSLVIFATFLTRSGVLSSVHSFAQSGIGPMFFGFIGVTFVVSLALLIYRWGDLRNDTELKSMLSRESMFLLNNLLFMAVLVVSFWGVVFPIISEVFTGQKITVGSPFYERANAPLFGAMMFLMAVAPLSAWGVSTARTLGKAMWKPAILSALTILAVFFLTDIRQPVALIGFFLVALVLYVTLYEFWRGAKARTNRHRENFFIALWQLAKRNRRRYGGYIVHISMMLLAIGILGIEVFQTETQGTIAKGESMELAGYTIEYADIAIWPDIPAGVEYTRATMNIYRDGEFISQLFPRIDYYFESQQPMTIPGTRTTLAADLYILLIDWEPATAVGATFKIYHNPLVNWMWIGSILFLLGIVFTAWPEKEPDRIPVQIKSQGLRTSAAD